jgi:hypothetical protein
MQIYRSLRPALLIVAALAAALGLSVRRPNLQARTIAHQVRVLPAEGAEADGTEVMRPDDRGDTAVDGGVLTTDGASPIDLDWRALAGLDLRSGRLTDLLRQVDGRVIRLPGYIVPLDDFAEAVTEFLLVPYFGACIHMPPPPPNQMVHVKVGGGSHRAASWARPVWVEGRLAVRAVTSPYGVVAYQLRAERITPYTER